MEMLLVRAYLSVHQLCSFTQGLQPVTLAHGVLKLHSCTKSPASRAWRIQSIRRNSRCSAWTALDVACLLTGGLVAIPVPQNVAVQKAGASDLPDIARLSTLCVMDCMTGKFKASKQEE